MRFDGDDKLVVCIWRLGLHWFPSSTPLLLLLMLILAASSASFSPAHQGLQHIVIHATQSLHSTLLKDEKSTD